MKKSITIAVLVTVGTLVVQYVNDDREEKFCRRGNHNAEKKIAYSTYSAVLQPQFPVSVLLYECCRQSDSDKAQYRN